MFKFAIVKFLFDAECKIDSTESSTIRRFLYRFFCLTENAFFFLYECTCMSQYTYACNLCKYMTYIVSYISWYIVSVFAFVKYFVQLLNVTMKINYISQNGKRTENNSMNRRTYKNSATNSQRIDIRHVAPLYRLTSSFRIRYFIFVIFPFYI